ncbi:glycoside hydrolase family 17 protein [Zalerion maritima]|uniref:glucan 1,3-beta-glucosidase n=1 Tax=Zalerion maritima TaxID=339359 RepID=A0AAD5RYW2_9PEZI|nr:glycoside hydrolase family 17 protein [Zalerion maritima]
MRFATATLTLLAASPAVVSAAGKLGWALGNKKEDGSTCKTSSDYEDDFDAIKSETGSTVVRTYSATDCNTTSHILPAAKSKDFQIVLGIWVYSDDEDDASFVNDFAEVKKVVEDGEYNDYIYAVTVGSESLYREDVSGDFLNKRIKTVKEAMPDGIKVGTADSWNKFQDGTANPVIEGGYADILLANAFSYWQGQKISNATGSFYDDVYQAFGVIQEKSGSTDGIELWVGETGWPTDGDDYQNAEPSVANAEQFYHEAICGMTTWGFNVFVFEAFDEPGKEGAVGEDGTVADETHWGAMNADRTLKWDSGLKC